MPETQILDQLRREFQLDRQQVEQAIRLLDEENTIWFIARYRKEQTGALDEERLQRLSERLAELRTVEARRLDVLRLLESQGSLTDELRQEVQQATSVQRIEDLYRPFRPKRRTRAGIAREKGLAPLARMIVWLTVPDSMSSATSPAELATRLLPSFDGVESPEDAWQGAQDLVAEWVTDDADVRESARTWIGRTGLLRVEAAHPEEEREPSEFDGYFGFRCPLSRLRPHQVLAIDRGEHAGVLRLRIEVDDEEFLKRMSLRVRSGKVVDEARMPPTDQGGSGSTPARGGLKEALSNYREAAIKDGFRRLLWPAATREVRNALTRKAHEHAIGVFGNNLRQLLLQPPLHTAVVMGIDPGYRAGCKVAVVSETGELLDVETTYPHPPQRQWEASLERLADLVRKHGVDVIAVGNGTAAHETQRLAVEVIGRVRDEGGSAKRLSYTMVNEAGASVYSASPLARDEFPDLDVTLRSAVSIARRLQDPLAELVKIDPKSIGVGLYQHDVDQSSLVESLDLVVASCVNRVGVELNTASHDLLRRVSGISTRQAAAIVDHRRSIGRFAKRSELRDVPGVGPKTFEQSVGFLRVVDGDEPLDRTAIHPESYGIARRLLQVLIGKESAALKSKGAREAVQRAAADLDLASFSAEWGVGLPTLQDIAGALMEPGRDPRTELPPPLLRTEVLDIEEVRPDMEFQGTVTNVVDFGAFVDIGLKKAGLVHISELSDRFVSDPFDIVSVGDVVQVRVVSVEPERGRIGLSLVNR